MWKPAIDVDTHIDVEASIKIFIKRLHCLEKCHKIINNQYKILSKYE